MGEKRHHYQGNSAFLISGLILVILIFPMIFNALGCAGAANPSISSGGATWVDDGTNPAAPSENPGTTIILLPSNYTFSGAPSHASIYLSPSDEISIFPSSAKVTNITGTKIAVHGTGDDYYTFLIPGYAKFIFKGSQKRQVGVKIHSFDTVSMRTHISTFEPINKNLSTFKKATYICQPLHLNSIVSDEEIKLRNEYGVYIDSVNPSSPQQVLSRLGTENISFSEVPSDIYQQYAINATQDLESPRIVYIDPGNGTMLGAGPTEFTIKFSEIMDLIYTPAVKLGQAPIAMISFEGVKWVGSIDIPSDGSMDSTKEVLYIDGARDQSGNRMIPSSSYSYRIAALDIEKPVISSISPPANSVLTAGTNAIIINFNEIMNTSWNLSVKIGEHSLTKVNYTGDKWTGNIIIPADGSWDSTNEIITVFGGRDLSGNVMDEASPGSYGINASSGDIIPPFVISVNPISGSALAFGTSEIKITFSEEMKTAIPPLVNLGLIELVQKTYANTIWTGIVYIPLSHQGTSEILYISEAQDLAGNVMLINSDNHYLIQVGG